MIIYNKITYEQIYHENLFCFQHCNIKITIELLKLEMRQNMNLNVKVFTYYEDGKGVSE